MKQTIIISLIASLIFFTLGYFIGTANINSASQLAKEANTFQAGREAPKKELADSDLDAPINNPEINNILGQVIAVKDNTVILKISPLGRSADLILDERAVKIDANTKIYILEQKDQAQYQSEMAEYNKKMQEQFKNMPKSGQTPDTSAAIITPPQSFTKKQGSVSDIKAGATINVIAVDKDIKDVKQFSATEINLQSTTIVATPPIAE